MREAVVLYWPLPYGRITYIRFQGSDFVLSAARGSPSVVVPSERGHYIISPALVNTFAGRRTQNRECFIVFSLYMPLTLICVRTIIAVR